MGSIEVRTSDFTQHSLKNFSEPFAHWECFIPVVTPQCHASNLLVLDNGDLLCAWFGGTQEGKPDISIYLSRKLANSQEWNKAARVTFDITRSEQNPVLFQTPTGDVWLLYTSQNLGDQDSAVVKKQVSMDRGSTWNQPEVIFNDPGTFIRQPVVVLDNGDWVLPTFRCRSEPGVRWVGNDDISAVRVSSDQGKTWTEREVPRSFGCVHMQIRRLKSGVYMALFRSRWADQIYKSFSADGVAWSEPVPTSLPNPNAGICFDVLPSGKVLVVYNHSSKLDAQGRREGLYDDIAAADDVRKNQSSKHDGKEAFWGAPRAPLCIALSGDEGESWRTSILEEGDGFCMTNNSEEKLNRELSYPSIAQSNDGAVHIAYTFWRQSIKYIQIDPKVINEILP